MYGHSLLLCAQVWSDINHLAGRFPKNMRLDPYVPFSELSMFAMPEDGAGTSFCLSLSIVCGLIAGFIFQLRKEAGLSL